MSSQTVNYSSSARSYGLIIHSEVTIGYDTPWRQVHQLLIDAAKATSGVMPEPTPFVLETSLSDFYPVYQINAYIQDADKMTSIYSDLHQNIQDYFDKAGVEILSPHYTAFRNGNASTIPKESRRPIKPAIPLIVVLSIPRIPRRYGRSEKKAVVCHHSQDSRAEQG